MSKLMIVDDDQGMIEGLKMALADEYEVSIAESAEECLQHGGRDADIVLTDYQMPGMSGLQLTAQLSQRLRPPTVIFFSAYLTVELEMRALAAGAKKCISKPFDLNTLKRELRQAAQPA